MATYSKELLSGSTQGKQIKVTQTASAGDTVHTAIAGTTDLDEIWLYAYNAHTASLLLTIQFGGTTSPDNDIKVTIPNQAGRVLVLDGVLLQNGLVVKAYAASANLIMLDGYVNRIDK
jgi:hypothetical protein